MKYAWHCAYCGKAALFSSLEPRKEYGISKEAWEAFKWKSAEDNSRTRNYDCEKCNKGLIPSLSFIHSVPMLESLPPGEAPTP